MSGVVPDCETDPTSAAREVTRVTHRDQRGDRTFFEWRRALEWVSIPVAFIVMRFVPDGRLRLTGWLLLVVAALLFAAPAVFASYREYQKTRDVRSASDLAVEYRLRLGLTLGEAVVPIGDLLGRIVVADHAERSQLQGQLRQRVVDAAAALVGADQARATFFVLEGRTLRASAWAGRPEPPATALARDEPGSDRAYVLMEERERILVPHLDDELFDPAFGGTYQAYIGVAVYAGHRNLGILCVDAPEAGDLAESDVDIIAALAQMLGPGLATM